MDETQSVELMRFNENMENTGKEFNYKQQSEWETFLGNLNKSWDSFLSIQENERNEFLSKLEMRKSVFLSTQKETQEEFYANEEYLQIKFKEKQFDEFSSLQMREECKSLTARKSISTCPTWDSQWGYLSGNNKQLTSTTGHKQKGRSNSSRRNSAPVCSAVWSAVSDASHSFLTCTEEGQIRQQGGQNMIQMNNQTPSPVPSLEFVVQNKKKMTEPTTNYQANKEEETNTRPSKPMPRTPKLSRKNTLDILKEEEEKDQACEDDPEILSITNRFSSFTNRVAHK